jgi:exodeoxyribonuclease VII large subunit
LYPVRVQGPGAALEIAQALADLNAWGGFDLIVLTRGGGSPADLWAFNEEPVVRAVAASRAVTLAAIGHATDLTLAELAADARAITPTAAAEAVFRDQAALAAHLEAAAGRLTRALAGALEQRLTRRAELERALRRAIGADWRRRRDQLAALTRPLNRLEDRLGFEGQRLDFLADRLARGATQLTTRSRDRLGAAVTALRLSSPAGRLTGSRRDLENLSGRSRAALAARLEESRARLNLLTARLADLAPQNILKRGYALVTRPGQLKPLTNSRFLRPGEEVAVRLAEGGFTARVKEKEIE